MTYNLLVKTARTLLVFRLSYEQIKLLTGEPGFPGRPDDPFGPATPWKIDIKLIDIIVR